MIHALFLSMLLCVIVLIGIPDLLMMLIQLTQSLMNERLSYIAELQCTVLDVKMIEGHGTTIDVILVNGVLNEGETIVVRVKHQSKHKHLRHILLYLPHTLCLSLCYLSVCRCVSLLA